MEVEERLYDASCQSQACTNDKGSGKVHNIKAALQWNSSHTKGGLIIGLTALEICPQAVLLPSCQLGEMTANVCWKELDKKKKKNHIYWRKMLFGIFSVL